MVGNRVGCAGPGWSAGNASVGSSQAVHDQAGGTKKISQTTLAHFFGGYFQTSGGRVPKKFDHIFLWSKNVKFLEIYMALFSMEVQG